MPPEGRPDAGRGSLKCELQKRAPLLLVTALILGLAFAGPGPLDFLRRIWDLAIP